MEIKFRVSDQLALDYLRYLFNAPAPEPIRLSLASDFGRMAIGLYKTSDTPIDQSEDDRTVTLVLPRHQTTAAAMTRYIYFTEADTKRLNMILDALFNIDLDTYYLQGIQAGMPKRDVIEGFVLSRRLVSADYAGTLSKRVYRTSLSAIRCKADIIHRKARYHFSRIQPPEPAKK
ncbi:hypothetical protein [uncultured Alistipes sp.]|uniref:hypothetical protein n=1 Tax=uncultured Alistipes sp. TaxID=538949 RepID=UPI00261C814F|nr:hypothetical protein [uncultured Alistipes sp.]